MIVIKCLAQSLAYNSSTNGGNGYNLSVSMRCNENIHILKTTNIGGSMHSGWKRRHYSQVVGIQNWLHLLLVVWSFVSHLISLGHLFFKYF